MSQKHCQRYSSTLFETYRVWGIFQCLKAVPSNPPLDTPCEMSDPAINVLREMLIFDVLCAYDEFYGCTNYLVGHPKLRSEARENTP